MVRIEDGRQFGPVPKAELDQWVAEGRVTAQTELIYEGADQWQPASSVYPGLGQPQPHPVANPFSDPTSPSAAPYTTPGGVRSGPLMQPNRSGLVLTLGILSIFFTCFTCFVLGITAWVMGQNDLRSMRNGTMDPSGYGTTQAGMILGAIATVLHGIWFLFMIAANA